MKSESGQTAVAAARALLELGLRFRAESIHDSRMAKIEQQIQALRRSDPLRLNSDPSPRSEFGRSYNLDDDDEEDAA